MSTFFAGARFSTDETITAAQSSESVHSLVHLTIWKKRDEVKSSLYKAWYAQGLFRPTASGHVHEAGHE